MKPEGGISMNLIDSLRKEFEHEAHSTRRQLERLPGDKLDWRPHEKSYTAGALAAHIVDCIRWTEPIFTRAELDVDPATYKLCQVISAAELLKTFDADVARCKQLLAGVTDEALMQPWRFKIMGRARFEKSRWDVFRDFTLSHLIHHSAAMARIRWRCEGRINVCRIAGSGRSSIILRKISRKPYRLPTDFAEVVGLSASHFKLLFREATGLPPHQYLIRRRVKRARNLLSAGELSISQIATETGFAHQSHLARHMHRVLGSPRALREMLR
jgi:AraC-like DNA-binding protein